MDDCLPKLFTLDEAADKIGSSVKPSTLRRAIQNEELTYYPIGGQKYVTEPDLAEYLRLKCVKAVVRQEKAQGFGSDQHEGNNRQPGSSGMTGASNGALAALSWIGKKQNGSSPTTLPQSTPLA